MRRAAGNAHTGRKARAGPAVHETAAARRQVCPNLRETGRNNNDETSCAGGGGRRLVHGCACPACGRQRGRTRLVSRRAPAIEHAAHHHGRADADQHAAASAGLVHLAGHESVDEQREHARPRFQPLPDRSHRDLDGGGRAAQVQALRPRHDQAAGTGGRARQPESRRSGHQSDRPERAAVEPGGDLPVLLPRRRCQVPAVRGDRRVVQLVLGHPAQPELREGDPGQSGLGARGGRGQDGADADQREGVVVVAAGVQYRRGISDHAASRAGGVVDVYSAEDHVIRDHQGRRRHRTRREPRRTQGRPDHFVPRGLLQVLTGAYACTPRCACMRTLAAI
ncbi:hypothetical protein PT2222_100236 [Paraburkholderia tropica]